MGLIDFNAHRMAIELLYGDVMTVQVQAEEVDPLTHESVSVWKDVEGLTGLMCHIDYRNADVQNGKNEAKQELTMSIACAPEHVIPSGSRIKVLTESNRIFLMRSSTPAMVVPSHQVIDVELIEELV